MLKKKMLYSYSVFQPAEALTGNLRNIFTDLNCKLMVRSSITKKTTENSSSFSLTKHFVENVRDEKKKFRSSFINRNEDVLMQGRADIEFFIMIVIQ